MGVRAPALAEILPSGAVGAEVEDLGGEGDAHVAALQPQELSAVSRATERRLREFAGGRACAHRALALLGIEPAPLPAGPDGAPVWPAGVVGSITHKGAYRAAAVALADSIAGLGLDAELDAAVPPGVLARIAHTGELAAVAGLLAERPGHAWDRLLFSAKEAAVKAAQPLGRGTPWLETTEVRLDAVAGTFAAVVSFAGGAESDEAAVEGRWEWREGLVVVSGWIASAG